MCTRALNDFTPPQKQRPVYIYIYIDTNKIYRVEKVLYHICRKSATTHNVYNSVRGLLYYSKEHHKNNHPSYIMCKCVQCIVYNFTRCDRAV